MDNEEFKLLMKARQNVYDLLRCFFLQEPAEQFLTALKDENILKDLKGYSKDLDEGIELIESALSPPDLGKLAAALIEEYTRLFAGPRPIPLYESVYRSAAGLVMQEQTAAVRQKFVQAGLTIHPDSSFPEDHIGAEIEFVYYLCQRAAQADQDETAKSFFGLQKEFMRDHLSLWIGPFCERLFSAARSSYFQGVAKLTGGFIRWDFEEWVMNCEP